MKTPCQSKCLSYLEIPSKAYKWTYNIKTKKNTWRQILNRQGFSVKKVSIGRMSVKGLLRLDLADTIHWIDMKGHGLLIEGGRVVADTCPVENDFRLVLGCYEITKMINNERYNVK